jgi:hypothetical protein
MADGEEPLRRMGCLPVLLTLISLSGAGLALLLVFLKAMIY